MKKLFQSLLVLLCGMLLFAGCQSGPKVSSIEVQEGVEFKLVDVLHVTNKVTNSSYYYFLGSVENHSDQEYHMSNLNYVLTSAGQTSADAIHPIDQFKTIITNNVLKGQSTFVYGYLGFPNNKQKNLGLYFPGKDVFIPFDSVKIRTIDDDNVVNSDDLAFTIYEDEEFIFDVDASDVTYKWEDGKSYVENLHITYKNKTGDRLVVPYLTPICTMHGIDVGRAKDASKYLKMDQKEIEAVDFSKNGMAPRTEPYTGEAYGYQMFYLSADQELTTDISFMFDGIIPDFSDPEKSGISININSAALGYNQIIPVKY